jgi:hypothetical protein
VARGRSGLHRKRQGPQSRQSTWLRACYQSRWPQGCNPMFQAFRRSAVLILFFGFAHAPAAQEAEFLKQQETAGATITDKTLRFVSSQYGEGALYLAPSGEAFLWLRGDHEVISGVWYAEAWHETAESGTSLGAAVRYFDVLFLEFPQSKKSVSLFQGVGWFEVLKVDDLDSTLGVVENVDGDVLRLQDGTVPCRACRAGMTISDWVASRSP